MKNSVLAFTTLLMIGFTTFSCGKKEENNQTEQTENNNETQKASKYAGDWTGATGGSLEIKADNTCILTEFEEGEEVMFNGKITPSDNGLEIVWEKPYKGNASLALTFSEQDGMLVLLSGETVLFQQAKN